MRISVLTEGGGKVGFGHLARCIALIQGFRGMRTRLEIKFIVNGDARARNFLKLSRANFKIFNWLKDYKMTMGLIRGSAIVVIDSYLAPKSFYAKIKGSSESPYVAVIDDYNRLNYDANVIINPSVCSENEAGYTKKSQVKHLAGPKYVILRKEFWMPSKKKISRNLKKVMITFGGIQHACLVAKIVDLLIELNLNFSIVKTGNKPFTPGRMRSLMERADLCISAGGQTTYELARCGVPVIGICFADNQKRNLECWQKIGFIKYAGRHNRKDLRVKLRSAISNLSDYRKRLIISRLGRKLIDGKGVRRIVKFIVRQAKDTIVLRDPTSKDMFDLWKWRNNLKVRKRCFNKEIISIGSHKAWFAKIMREPMVKMYIAEERGKKIGVIRMDGSGKNVLVNVNLNPRFMGHGLGSRLIRQGTLKFLEEMKTHSDIFALTEKDNWASRNAFVKAGYVRDKKQENRGYFTYIYRVNAKYG
jgi:spore coat polysaccharide biosynthesis predicted glycosyltransferase SpsG/RimJ/RimL family protein N-acetyltransferase